MAFDREQPFVGFHTRIKTHEGADALCKLIEEGLAPMGINQIVLEITYNYMYQCFPEYVTGTITHEDARKITDTAKKYGIKMIPLFQSLSHQSPGNGDPFPLLKLNPQFIENKDIKYDATWPDVYCHSWCASNDDIYNYVFPMMDELIEAFDAEVIHIGIDEVFDIGEDSCPLCNHKDKAYLLARTVKKMHDYLKNKGIETMIWGDRLLDAKKLGYQMWEADVFGMHKAFDMEEITRDILVCDWHYDMHDHGYPSLEQFVKGGFYTIPSFGGKVEQASHFWHYALEEVYKQNKFHYKGKIAGGLFTNWGDLDPESVDKMLSAMHGKTPEWTESWHGAPVGEVIKALAKALPKFKKP